MRRETAVLEALMKLAPNKWYWSDRLPRDVWQVLQDSLPEGSLRGFLQQHPWHFEVAPPVADRKGMRFKVIYNAW